jgi:hypothetical protein
MLLQPKKQTIVLTAACIALGLVLHVLGGTAGAFGAPLLLAAALAALIFTGGKSRPKTGTVDKDEDSGGSQQARAIAQELGRETTRVSVHVLGAQYRREQWKAIESVVDSILESFLQLMRRRLDAHTIAVLFPTTDGGYRIRKYDSKSDCINADAVIYPGKGVLGSFLKDGLKQLNLHDIVSDSMTLHYYTRDAGIR